MLLQWPSPQAAEALARVEAVAAEIVELASEPNHFSLPTPEQFSLAEETFVDHFAKALAKTGTAFHIADLQSDLFENH